MSKLLEILNQAINPATLNSISQQVGITPAQTQGAIGQTLPLLVGALTKTGNSGPNGWSLLSGFLDKNHDGNIIDDLVGMALGGSASTQNSSALQQLLGGKLDSVTQHLQGQSGLTTDQISKLLPLLAPMVIGALAKVQKTQSLDQTDLSQFLEKENTAIKENPATSMMTALFDKDGDGNVVDDIMGQGAAMLGKFLGGK